MNSRVGGLIPFGGIGNLVCVFRVCESEERKQRRKVKNIVVGGGWVWRL